MLIVFANQKGGCGKSTNCIYFANWLVNQGKEVMVFDMDFQKSISDRRKDDAKSLIDARENDVIYDNELPYEIKSVTGQQMNEYLPDIKKIGNDAFVIVDTPGNIDDDMEGVLRTADAIIIPFNYDRISLDSTGVFIAVLVKLKLKAKIIFLPNKLKASVKYETIEDANNILTKIGLLAPAVRDRVALERISTLEISNEIKGVVNEAYSFILKKIK